MDKYALAKLVDWSGSGGLAGRKRLQKVVYFLQHVGLPCGAEYTLHHYGPYSRDVAEACDELVALGLLTERSESVGPGEGPRYAYELAPPGIAALAQADRQPGSGAARISGFQPVAQNLVGRDPPRPKGELTSDYSEWEAALKKEVRAAGYAQSDMYCLPDTLKGKYRQPYFPEKESDEQSVRNAIRVRPTGGGTPVEITQVLPRLRAVTTRSPDQRRYYVPKDVRPKAMQLAREWKP